MKFPTLYKKTNTGAIQFWSIEADETNQGFTFGLGEIRTIYGQVGTNSPQITDEVIKEGKNIGKKNETTPPQQAEVEAKAKFDKQKKKGYVESIEAAQNDETDDLIEGGIVPMLAHTFEKQGHKIKYPCYVQPKIDGIRCIAIVKDGKCTLWSRTRKQITSCPHIVSALEKIRPHGDIVFDGELYNHQYKDNFEHIVHLVRQEEPDPKHEDVQYHIYDLAIDGPFNVRNSMIQSIPYNLPCIVKVDTGLAHNEENAVEWFERYRSKGYEGAMLRNANGLYVNKRSTDLIKVKEMQDDEFEITGIEEGRGRLAGHVGAFVCKTKDGQEFKAKPAGATERLREYFCNHGLWKGRQLVVQYQSLTSYGLPRFPVGLRLKEEI